MNWTLLGILFAVALVGCAMGFKRFVWFMSVGYGYAVAGVAIAALCYGAGMELMTIPLAIALLVCAAYGLRLGTFLLKRETGNKAYKKILDAKVGKEPPMFVKVVMWLSMGVIYLAQTAGLHFRMVNQAADDACLYAGIVIMAIGAVIEALADKQKSEQKNKNPNMVATEGLFRFMRCPNYFGEILFWTGVFVSGLTAYAGAFQWIVAVLGYVCIVAIMLIGAKNMEKGHISRYGDKPEYRAYADKTPILFPFIPLYHLNNQ
ncbi:MAG: DUF1295 domain-containing protein [Clostridiales bacterium]|nr:DUF1295 domain-containing protein [Clostridiales bacterium]